MRLKRTGDTKTAAGCSEDQSTLGTTASAAASRHPTDGASRERATSKPDAEDLRICTDDEHRRRSALVVNGGIFERLRLRSDTRAPARGSAAAEAIEPEVAPHIEEKSDGDKRRQRERNCVTSAYLR